MSAESASAPTGLPRQLSISVVPPRLPADNGSYHAVVVSLLDSGGRASVALSSVVVYLSSSLQNVATVQSPVTIPPGRHYVVVELNTTSTPGTTVITASSAGLVSASESVATATPSGFPWRLQVYAAPAIVLSGPSQQGVIVVELLDQKGVPTKAGSAFVVQMSSSDTRVANVSENYVVIPAGAITASENFSTAYIPGTSTIAAAASGLLSGSANVKVTGSSPLYLKTFAQPGSIGLDSTGRLTVGLADAQGDPTRAPASLVVQITSSNLTVATTPASVVIPAGSSFAVSNYTTTNDAGTALLTFSASGLNSGPAVSVRSVSTYGLVPVKIAVVAGPALVLADSENFSVVTVSLLSVNDNPAPESHPVTVKLTSSNTQVGSVPPQVVIPANSNFASVQFETTFYAGNTTVTAFANGLVTGQAEVSTFGPVPYKLELRGIPSTLLASGNSYSALEVLLEDEQGGPAFAGSSIAVQLLSSQSGVVSVDSSVTIPAGSYSAVAHLYTTLLSGSANITAFTNMGLATADISIQTVTPAPSAIAAFIAPGGNVLSSVGGGPILVVQLQDSAGNPARAAKNITALVTSSNSSLLSTPIPLTIYKGMDYVMKTLDVLLTGSTTLTITSPGLVPTSTSVTVSPLSLSVTRTPSLTTILANETQSLQLTILMEGSPVTGATTHWSTTVGVLNPNLTATNSQGVSSVTFAPPSAVSSGRAVVTANTSSPDFGQIEPTFVIIFTPPPIKSPPTLGQKIIGVLPYVGAVAAVVIVAVAFITIQRRRQRAREELEAGFQTLS